MARKGGKMDYKCIEDKAFADDSLSFKAKGILYTIIKSEGNLDTCDKILAKSNDGLYAVTKGIHELVNHGYLRLEMQRDQNGKIIRRGYVLVERKEK